MRAEQESCQGGGMMDHHPHPGMPHRVVMDDQVMVMVSEVERKGATVR